MSTPLLAGLTPTYTTSNPSSCSSSPCPTDCSALLRSLWTDLSSDVCAVSSSITSWLSSFTSLSSHECSSSACQSITHPHRLPIDTYLHWLRYHRHTWLHTIPRPQHQRRKGTFLLHDDESDDEREDDEREETLISSYHDYKTRREHQRQQYIPTTCTCQRDARHTGTCRNTTLLVAACAGLYERSSLRHSEFIAPRHLGVATDDVIAPPTTTPSCDSTECLSAPSSPHLSSQWFDDDSDVDMTRSASPIPSPMSHMTRVDSHGHLSMDMVDSESDVESEHELESVDGDIDPTTVKDSKSALRRRSSIQPFLPGMSRSALVQRLALETPASTSPNTSCAPKTRRLVTSTTSPIPSSSSTDVLDQLWSIHDGAQLESMKQSLRVSNN